MSSAWQLSTASVTANAITKLQVQVNEISTSARGALPLTGGTMQGPINMNSNPLVNLPAPNAPNSAARKADVDLAQLTANAAVAGVNTLTVSKQDANANLTSIAAQTPSNTFYLRGDGSAFRASTIAVGDLPSHISTTKIGNGVVSDTEFSYVQGTTSRIQTQLNSKVNATSVGVSNGLATLDAGGKLTFSQIPDSIVGALVYEGTWNAATNTPTLAPTPAASTQGDYYVVSAEGTQFGIAWKVGDWIISSGAAWQKIDNHTMVTSVFDRTGSITAAYGDYSADKISNVPAGSISATNVQDALNELGNEKLALAGGTMTGNINMSGTQRVTNVAAPVALTDVARKVEVDAASAALEATKQNLNAKLTAISSSLASSGSYLRGDGTNFVPSSLLAADMPTGIDAARIADGSVSNAEFQYLDGVTAPIQTQLNARVLQSSLGAASGVATLDGTGQLTGSQIPAALVGALVYKGSWDASLNAPALSAAPGSQTTGNYYVVSVGATRFGILWQPGDWIVSIGSGWQKVNNQVAGVASVFTRTGDVTAAAGDYNASQITNTASGSITATNVQDALNGLDTSKLALAGGTMSGTLNMNSNALTNLPAPTNANDAARKTDVDAVSVAKQDVNAKLTTISSQTATSGRYLRGDGTNFVASALLEADLPSSIDASKIGGGNVSNDEFNRLDGVSAPIQTQLNDKVATALLGASNGVATLDANAKLTTSQIPSSLVGALVYEGTWDANTNTPALSATPAADTKGDYYVVSVAGTRFGIAWMVGDWAISSGAVWQKVDNQNNVTSVFSRVGVITAASGDYNASQITNTASGSISSTNVQDALNGLDTSKLALAGGTMSGTLNMNSNAITNLSAPSSANDAARKADVDTKQDGNAKLTAISSATATAGNFLRGNGTNFVSARIATGDLPTGINALNIADGSVSDTEFSYLNGLTGSIQPQLDSKIASSQRNVANGVATLDGNIRLLESQLPTSVVGALVYKGTWNADANNPALNAPPAVSPQGNYYVVAVRGTQFSTLWEVGDWIVSSGTAWQKVDNAVSSVFGRIGNVVATAGDYDAAQITNTPAGSISATDVQGALNGLDTSKLALAGGTMSGTLNMNSNAITNLPVPTGANDAARKADVDTKQNSNSKLTAIASATPAVASYLRGDGTAFVASSILAGDLPFSIDAGRIAGGNVSNDEYNALDGVTSSIQTQLNNKVATALLGAVNGVATLDANAKLTTDQIPSSLVGALVYEGTWNADTNTPALSATPTADTKGDYYIVSNAGTRFGISWMVGDWAISSGSSWQKVDNQNHVTSVFSRVGVVTAASGDYNASQITNTASGSISSTNVQDALNGLDTSKLALAGGTMSGTLNMNSNSITNLPAPSSAADAARKGDVDAVAAAKQDLNANLTTISSQTATSGQYLRGNGTNFVASVLLENDLPSSINANRIAGNNVSNDEFNRLAGVSAPIQTQLNDRIPLTQKAAANGVASLDANTRLPAGQLPLSVVGALVYKGEWDAAANNPALGIPPAVSPQGNYYVVSVAGTRFSTSWAVNDWIVSSGTNWQKVDNQIAGVSSVFTRTGDVVAAAGDYNATQITNTPSGSITATDVQNALNGLDTSKLALAGGTMSGTLNMNSNTITNLPAPSNANDAARKADVDAVSAAKQDVNANLTTISSQTATSGRYLRGNGTNFVASALLETDLPSSIDASKIGGGNVSNDEFNRLDGVSAPIQTQLNDRLLVSQRGAANGVAALDANGKLSPSQLPGALAGALVFITSWDANTNTPLLPTTPTSDTQGNYYVVAVRGTRFGQVWEVNDWIVSSGTGWQKVDNAVSTVFGRIGNVVAASGDYVAAQITNTASGSITATNVQDALNGLDSSKLALAGGTMSGTLNMNSNAITNLPAPSNANDAARKADVDTKQNSNANLTAISSTTPTLAHYLRGDGTNYAASVILEGDLPSSINAAKIGGGNVSNDEFNRLDGVSAPIQTQLDNKVATSLLGAVNGVATLDANAKLSTSQIPSSLVGALVYEGTWNAAANTPTLSATPAADTKGDYYVVSDAGTQFGIAWMVGDWIISSGAAWQKVDNQNHVTSVFSRTGAVSAAAGDYNAAQITNTASGSITATNVQDALNGLDSSKLALAGGTMSGTLNMNSNSITNLPAPSSANDAARKADVDTKQNSNANLTAISSATPTSCLR